MRFPNLVKGNWNAVRPLSLVVSDMTCVRNKGALYEWTLLLDTYNNEILAHGLARNGNALPYYHCLDVLKQKVWQHYAGGVAHRSGRRLFLQRVSAGACRYCDYAVYVTIQNPDG